MKMELWSTNVISNDLLFNAKAYRWEQDSYGTLIIRKNAN
jgi:hypothetical protein